MVGRALGAVFPIPHSAGFPLRAQPDVHANIHGLIKELSKADTPINFRPYYCVLHCPLIVWVIRRRRRFHELCDRPGGHRSPARSLAAQDYSLRRNLKVIHPTMSLQSLMSGADCAVQSNPLAQVMKHTEGDRSLQQDRIAGPSSSRVCQ